MTKRNILDAVGQKSRWPHWLPYPSCWLKSFVLMLFLRVIMFVGENLVRFGYNFAKFTSSLELLVIFALITVLSPIAVISFTHHYLHLLLGRFMPEIQAPEVGDVKGLVPNLMSWWEGLYGWLVITLSTLMAFLLCTLIFPMFNLSYTRPFEAYIQFQDQIILVVGTFWLITGALIYQIDYLVKERLISVYSSKAKSPI